MPGVGLSHRHLRTARRQRLGRPSLAPLALLLAAGLMVSGVDAAERTGPILIGALTESWGPTPHVVGLRDGLVDLLFTDSHLSGLAAKTATSRLPVVFAGGDNPVGQGLVQSFARPGGNVTGVTSLDLELVPKRLEVFREITPGLRRVLFAYDATSPAAVAEATAYRDAARRLGIVLVEKPVRSQEEAQRVLAQVRKGEVDGIVAPGFLSWNVPGFVLEATSKVAIPTMFGSTFYVERGGLASYGPDNYASGRQAARLVDKIIKGVKPAGIPVEVNTKTELHINVKVARTLGLTIAPEVLYRADRLFR